MQLRFTLKDPDGIYDAVISEALTAEQKEDLSSFFQYGDYLRLEYDTETKDLTVVKSY